jgi:hypothetical protein
MSPFSHRFAGAIRGQALADLTRPVRAIERDANQLHKVERRGESEWTPWIAILGLVLFFASAFVVMGALSFTAYYLAR